MYVELRSYGSQAQYTSGALRMEVKALTNCMVGEDTRSGPQLRPYQSDCHVRWNRQYLRIILKIPEPNPQPVGTPGPKNS